jgi:hypothetical protein
VQYMPTISDYCINLDIFQIRNHLNLSVPYFLLQSLKEMSLKVQRGKQEFLPHQGLIKMLVSNALRILKHRILWEYFINMKKQYFKEVHASMSEEERNKGEEPKRLTKPRKEKKKRGRKRKRYMKNIKRWLMS